MRLISLKKWFESKGLRQNTLLPLFNPHRFSLMRKKKEALTRHYARPYYSNIPEGYNDDGTIR